MNHINFLEKKSFDFRQITFNTFFILLACGAFLFFMMVYGLVQKIRLDATQNKLAAKLAQVEAMQGMKQPVPSGETSSSVSFAPEKRMEWSLLLNAIGSKAEEGIWIQSLSGLSESRTLKIEGGGAHWQAVSRFEKELEMIPSFQKVSLLSSETVPGGNIVFKIEGLLK